MDEFFKHLFSDEEPPEHVPYSQRPEVLDAIDRVLACKKHHDGCFIDVSEPVSTSNPQVQRLDITIIFDKGRVAHPHQYVVWVDDFELVFRLVDDTW
jgi:hypothetical protein